MKTHYVLQAFDWGGDPNPLILPGQYDTLEAALEEVKRMDNQDPPELDGADIDCVEMVPIPGTDNDYGFGQRYLLNVDENLQYSWDPVNWEAV